MRRFYRPVWAVVLVLMLSPSESGAQKYATGDIGAESRARLEARAADFNLKLVFTLLEGNYVSDVEVAVTDASGNRVLAVRAEPILYVSLPRGTYFVDATYAGRPQTRRFTVGERLHTEVLRWPSNPDNDLVLPKESAEVTP